VRYYEDFVAPHKVYRAPTDLEREALTDLRDRLIELAKSKQLPEDWEKDEERWDEELLQGIVYDVGRDRFEPLRDWFTALYEVLLGASQGPRFGGFIALYGVEETVALIDRAQAGEMA
jgi:lysyl-tRNA synthetase class 1